MMPISASTAPIRVKQKPLYSQLNAEYDKHYYNNLFKYLKNPPESLYIASYPDSWGRREKSLVSTVRACA